MRLSHRELEQARRDPDAYLRERMGGRPAPGKPSALRFWQLSVYVFHRNQENLASASQYLEAAFRRNFVTGLVQERRVRVYLEHLERYAQEFHALHHTVASTKVNVKRSVVQNIEIGGEIGRVELTPQGYALCLLVKSRPPLWRDELRMPILQQLVADRLAVPPGVVETGVYDLESESHDWHAYSEQEIDEAFQEVTRLAERLATAAARAGYIL